MDTASSHKATQAGFDQEFLKKLEYLTIVAKKVFAGRSRADRRTRRAGSGIEFADHLDWAVYGRMNRLLLRQFEQEEDLHIYVLVDTSTSMRLGATPGQPLLVPG